MYAWRRLDPKVTAGFLARLADPKRPLPRWLASIRLRADSYWPFVF
jgi:hypothetical protein